MPGRLEFRGVVAVIILELLLPHWAHATTAAMRAEGDRDCLRHNARLSLRSTAEQSRISDMVSGPTTARVRSTDATILNLLNEGNDRSATFRTLTDKIARTDGIVYIEFGYCSFGHLNGCLLPFIAASHCDRYLRILVTPDKSRRSHDQLVAVVAHEMRHALEVLEQKEVVDVPTMEAMYRKIGTPLTGGMTGYETSAARAAGDAVLSELLAKRP